MIEVYENIHVGDEDDYEFEVKGQDGWAIVHACKEPYHRDALGYSGRSVSADHPEYLVAKRNNRLILNMVDVENPNFFKKGMINQALEFIQEQLDDGKKVLIHCNQGESRGPSIGLLYLALHTDALSEDSFQNAEEEFQELYPSYNPKSGIRQHLKNNWDHYSS